MDNETSGFIPKLVDRILNWGVKKLPSEEKVRTIVEDPINPPPIINLCEFLVRPEKVEVGRVR